MKNVRKRINLKLFEKDYDKKISNKQSKLKFNGTHELYSFHDGYTFKQMNLVLTDKPNYVGFAALEVSKLSMYEIYQDILQPYFGGENTASLQ